MADAEIKKIKKKPGDPVYNTETMMPFSEIQQDTVIMKDWWLRAVVKVVWINLDLKNNDEIDIVIEQYRRFINAMGFPVQILIRNTYLDLSDYLNYMRGNVDLIENPILKWQWDKYIQFLDWINLQQWLVFNKEFYVVVPYYPAGWDAWQVNKSRIWKLMQALNAKDSAEKVVWRYRGFIKNKRGLDSRVWLITDGLTSMWLTAKRLNLKELTELYFKYFNPQADSSQA